MIKRKDGSYSRRGLWDNIRANKGSGKKPTKEMLEQERKINAKKYEDGGPKDPPRIKKGFLGRLFGFKGAFSPGNIAPGSAAAQERNRQGCTSPDCIDMMGGRDAAGWTRTGGGSMGGMDTQSGQAPPPLEVMGRADADKANFLEDIRYPDKVIVDPKTGEKTIIQDRSKPYNMFQRLGNRIRGYEKTDFGGATMGGKNMEYVDPNSPINTNMGTKEEPLGTLNWPMNYGAGTSTNTNTTGTTQIPMRPIASQEKPKFQIPNFMMNQNTDTDMHPNREDFEKSQAMNVKPKFQKAPDFKKGGFKNKSFIEDSKEITFGRPSNKMKRKK